MSDFENNSRRKGRAFSDRHRFAMDDSSKKFRESDMGSQQGRSSTGSYGGVRRARAQKTSSQHSGVIPNAYSRRLSRGDYMRQIKKRKRKKILLVVLTVLLIAVLGAGGVAFAYYQSISSNMHRGVDDDLREALVDPQYVGDPFYLLLMGTDGSAEREASEEYAGDSFRSDSMILARIDPKQKKVTMVSLHRDTRIDMGEYGINKLNAAHALGGPAYTVEVVSKFAGVPISQYAEINFDGFKEVVDALGGVEVDVPMEIDDPDAGGHLDAGLQTLNGDQALILCRARHAYDDYGDGDTYRAANQRLVLSAIAKKILSADLPTIASTVETLSQYVTTTFELTDIIALAQNLRGLNPDKDIYSAMEPTTSSLINGIWFELTNEQEWRTMMQRVDQGLPPVEEDIIDEASNTILARSGDGGSSGVVAQDGAPTVSVLNGAGVEGIAGRAADDIKPLGYATKTGNAGSSDFETTLVIYDDESQQAVAQNIVNALGAGRAMKNDGSYTLTTDILVIVGFDRT